jgi:transposase
MPVLVGIEACGNSQCFVDFLERLGHPVWIGDAAQIRASYVRRQKTDRRDAGHILRLLLENRFPRLWTPTAEQRDLRQLLVHRHKLVEIRTRVKNGLQHLALKQNVGYPEIALIESSPRVPLVSTKKAEGLVGRSRIQH